MAFTGDAVIFPALLKLKDCLCNELDQAGLSELCDCELLHGLGAFPDQPAIGKGIAWVGLNSIFPSKLFPSPDGDIENCTAPLAAAVSIGVIRCYKVRERGETLDEMRGYLDMQMADMAAMRRAIVCCAKDEDIAVSLGTYTPLGPDGGSYGGVWNPTIGGI